MSKNIASGFSLLELVVALTIFNIGLALIDWHFTHLFLKLGQQEAAIQKVLAKDRQYVLDHLLLLHQRTAASP